MHVLVKTELLDLVYILYNDFFQILPHACHCGVLLTGSHICM